ncbi:MAG: PrsW family glutamic-type intramembrane protease, partial [Verrucomicrobiota bacterium]
LAVLAGIFSAALTIFVLVIQERLTGFIHVPTDDVLSQLIYCVAGIGLREETLKLLCFLPFAFWAAKRRSRVEGLVLAGLVGLGFAWQENLGYFEEGENPYVIAIRPITANALHIADTGIIGYWLTRTLIAKGRGWENFLLAFILIVIAHGIYDAVIIVPDLQEYGPLTTIFVAVIAYKYFDPLREEMDIAAVHRRMSPLGIFIIGMVLLCNTVLISSAFREVSNVAIGAFAAAVGSCIPLSFAFISRFRDL